MKENKIDEWISIGSNRRDAVICQILSEDRLEVVYLDNNGKAINEYVVLKDNIWCFENSNPCGGYADNSERLSLYVSTLREGKRYMR